MTAEADIVLSIEHVAVHFGGLIAISDLNFEVREGEIVGLIGPNGAGKTTAFNVITGFLKPTSGKVRYRTTSLGGLKPHEIARLGLVRTFQRTSVFQTNSSKYVRHRCAQISWLGVASEDSTTRSGVATRSAIAPAATGHKSPFCHNLRHNGR